ncbi:outer membrane protein assembly factor [bacterium]|nr:outer membrane protein assembly factor [bacterium]
MAPISALLRLGAQSGLRCLFTYVTIIALLLFSAQVYAQTSKKDTPLAQLIIKGVDKEQAANIKAHLGDIELNHINNRRWQTHFVEKVDIAMQALGYFHASTKLRTDKQTLYIDVRPGEPTRILQSSIQITGEGAEEENLHQLKNIASMQTGAILNSQLYDAAKNQWLLAALNLGYLDATLSAHRVEVNRDNKTASIFLTLHTGPLYRMGNFSYGDVPVDSALIDKQMNWTIGERFSQRHVIELQKRLLDTRYFSSVRLEQRVDKANRRVDIHAHLHMRKRNAVDLGIGFATDTGPRANIAWNKPWFNSRGHSVQLKSGISGIAYDTAITYRIPTKSKRDRYWQSDFYLGEQRIEDTESTQENLGLAYVTPFGSGWQGSLSSRYALEQYEQADESGRSELLLFGISASKTRSKGGLIPTEGSRYSASIEAASDGLLSDASFARVLTSAKWLNSLDKHRFFSELQLGALYFYQSTSLRDIPSSLRFFAGGDSSVRGYDYKSISPTNDNGELIGGKYLAVARAEYSYRFRPKWRAALFVDSGSVFNSLDDSSQTASLGPGAGIHWLSPIGAIRFDIGVGLQNDNAVRLHIALGPEL